MILTVSLRQEGQDTEQAISHSEVVPPSAERIVLDSATRLANKVCSDADVKGWL